VGWAAPDEVQINSIQAEAHPVAAQLNAVNPEAVVIWVSSDLGAKMVKEICKVNSTVPIYLCQRAAAAIAAPRSVDDRREDREVTEPRSAAPSGGVWMAVSRQADGIDRKAGFHQALSRTYRKPAINSRDAGL